MGDRSKISIEMDDTLQELEVYQSLGLPHYLKSPETQIQHHFKHKNNFNFLKDMPFQTCFSCFFNGWLFPKIWKSNGEKKRFLNVQRLQDGPSAARGAPRASR